MDCVYFSAVVSTAGFLGIAYYDILKRLRYVQKVIFTGLFSFGISLTDINLKCKYESSKFSFLCVQSKEAVSEYMS